VINNRISHITVSEWTRDKVLKAVEKLNYHVNDQARALRRGRSNTIGVVASDITQPFSGLMLRTVEQEVHRRGYSFLLSDIQNNREREKFYLDLFLQKNVDGVLFLALSNELEEEGILRMKDRGIPVVLTERELPDNPIPCVMVDNVKGGLTATEHLLDQDYRHIAFLTGPEGNLISRQRMDGYRQALANRGIEFSDSWVAQGGLGLEGGYRAMEELLDRSDRPKAVFAFNDMEALGALRAIRDRGLTVPRDIALVGFDDLPIAAYSEPTLTTVRQPVEEMCYRAAEILLDILDGKLPKDFYRKSVLEPALIVRDSSIKKDLK
jgi:LacI family transcriptional regulator, repressor for deo operon, udp, cdd, tsx, nupC, and nupG